MCAERLDDELLETVTGGANVHLSFDYAKKGTRSYSCDHLSEFSDFWSTVMNVENGQFRFDGDPCPYYEASSPSFARTPGYQYCRFCSKLKPL